MLPVRRYKCLQEYEVSKSHNKNTWRYLRNHNNVFDDKEVRFRVVLFLFLFHNIIVFTTYGPCFVLRQKTSFQKHIFPRSHKPLANSDNLKKEKKRC